MGRDQPDVRVVEDAITYIERYPEVVWTHEDGRLIVEPEDSRGFFVRLEDGGPEATLWCHDWHQHFSEAADCLKFFKGVMERRCRVRTSKKGRIEYAWSLEVWNEGEWQTVSLTALFLFPYWLPKKDFYYENPPRISLAPGE